MIHILDKLDPRIPSWDRQAILPRPCPFCSSEGSDFLVRPDGLTVKQCPLCDCRFVSPAPSADELQRFYASYSASHRVADLRQAELEMRVPLPGDDIRLEELRSITDWHGKRALDVGCGLGLFLRHLQAWGMEIAGVDLDPRAVQFANAQLQTDRVLLGGLDRFADSCLFDLVVMNDLIEHPLDPLRVLAQGTRLLAPSGCLLLWTPNGRFTDPRFPANTTFRVDLEHMQYLTVATMQFVAKSTSLSLVHLETCGDPDLAAVARAPAKPLRSVGKSLNRFVRRLLGALLAQRLRDVRDAALGRRQSGGRSGTYHLFAILQKSQSR